jgi:hypothetical protein
VTSTSRTARCGPACRMVWQERSLEWLPLMPILQGNQHGHFQFRKVHIHTGFKASCGRTGAFRESAAFNFQVHSPFCLPPAGGNIPLTTLPPGLQWNSFSASSASLPRF